MNYIVWFDIPVKDIDKACNFYGAVLDVEIKVEDGGGAKMGVLPHSEKSGTAGCLVETKELQPANVGPLLYFNADGRLEEAVIAAKQNGGEVVEDKRQIGEYGFRALVKDCCGNLIALHSS